MLRLSQVPFAVRVCGVDPGLDGGIAVYEFIGSTRLATVRVVDMPTERVRDGDRDIDDAAVDAVVREMDPYLAVLERVWSMPTDGKASAFSFGRNYGAVRSPLRIISEVLLNPPAASWKAKLAVPADKKLSDKRAERLLPLCAPLWEGKRDGVKDGGTEACMLGLYDLFHLGLIPIRITPIASTAV